MDIRNDRDERLSLTLWQTDTARRIHEKLTVISDTLDEIEGLILKNGLSNTNLDALVTKANCTIIAAVGATTD